MKKWVPLPGILLHRIRRKHMEKDIIWEEFFSENERYADIINSFLDSTTPHITKEDIKEMNTRTKVRHWLERFQGNRIFQEEVKYRDTLRKVIFHTNFLLLGIENQETIDYAMPLRNMSYDVAEYERQAKKIRHRNRSRKLKGSEYLYRFRKTDRLYPVITIVLYFGKEPWNGPTELCRMMDFSGIPQELRGLVQNYRIPVIDVRRYKDTSRFQTDVREVFEMIQNAEDREKIEELVTKNSRYQNMEEDAVMILSKYIGIQALWNRKKDYKKEDGKMDMCQGIKDWLAEEREKGMEQGRNQGLDEGQRRGRAEGRIEGEKINLVRLVCKKLEKQKTVEEISVELEEPAEQIMKIVSAAKRYEPEYDVEKIYEDWKRLGD